MEARLSRSKLDTNPWVTPNLVRLPSVATAVEGALDKALAYCTEKMNLHGETRALEHLRQGDRLACTYIQYSLAQQVAEILGRFDATVQQAYLFDMDATPEDIAFADPVPMSIHMIVRTERRTEALSSLIRAIENALVHEYAALVGPSKLEYLLDVQLVDASDVAARRGYAAMLTSLHNRPIQVWHR